MGEKGAKATSAASAAAESLVLRLARLGDVRGKKMFGGHGIFHEDKMFALVDSSGRIFFKVDAANASRYEDAGADKHGRMPYYAVPDDVLADDGSLQAWAQHSITAAQGK